MRNSTEINVVKKERNVVGKKGKEEAFFLRNGSVRLKQFNVAQKVKSNRCDSSRVKIGLAFLV